MKLFIGGDVVPTATSAEAFRTGDTQALFHDLLPVFATGDRVLINLECALTKSEAAIPKFGPNLKGPVEAAQTLKKAGVTDCSLCNNHTFDFGIEGMQDTIRAVESAGMQVTGVGCNEKDSRRPLVMPVGNKKLAIIAVCEHEYTYALPNQMGATPFDPFETLSDIHDAKEKYDYVIVIYHGAKEFCRYPSPRIMKACRAMVHLGADAVLCQHSHIIGCMEKYENGVILYGQGNFHFLNYMDSEGWNEGLLAQFDFDEENGGFAFHLLPVLSTDVGIRLATPAEKAAILEDMEKRNQSLQDGSWLDGWRAFCDSMKTIYESTVFNCTDDPENPRLKEHFAHYLDCEAHTDVYRELFKTWHARGINQ